MGVPGSVVRWGGTRVSRRLARSVPFFGAVVAFAMLGAAIRRKGVVRGSVDTGLNAMPFVGALKTAIELVRGRDLIADRRRRV